MSASTFAKGLATVMCGAWLWASGMQPGDAAEQVQTIRLRGGELRLVNNDEKKPKAVFNGKEFLFEPESIEHRATFRLSDRDVVILVSDKSVLTRPRVFTFGKDGAAEEIQILGMRDHVVGIKKGDAVHLDLGYFRGLKIDAIVSPKGVAVSEKRMRRPAFDRNTCRWLHNDVLTECIDRLNEACNFISIPTGTAMRLNDLEQHPRWKLVSDRFEASCEAACKANKKPAYTAFAKDVCGP